METVEGDNDRHLRFQIREEEGILYSSSGMNANTFFASTWDPVVSLNRHDTLGAISLVSQASFGHSHYTEAMQNHPAINNSSHFVHYISDQGFPQMPKLPSFESGCLAELVNPFGQSNCDHGLNADGSDENMLQSGDELQLSEETATGGASKGKRRRRESDTDAHFYPTLTSVAVQKDHCNRDSNSRSEQDDKKSKNELPPISNTRGKQPAKQSKDNHQGSDVPKDGYIHVRARRGQATNSHSLAERVRREKISERMKTLQELVPGCNKITGKAVMLDEIINYVQSLQQQVEFLSMKLATVNPEINIDVEKILSKDIIYARGTSATTIGFGTTNSAGLYRGTIPLATQTNILFPPMNQPVLETELQSFLHTGYDSTSAMNNVTSNGRLKPEV